jgi:hypothetical protein
VSSTRSRDLFIAPLLVQAETPMAGPPSHYDEARDLTVLDDGAPLVEATATLGTATFTKNEGERDDLDAAERFTASAGTLTSTAVTGEREDSDHSLAWATTQLDTRTMPVDTERD